MDRNTVTWLINIARSIDAISSQIDQVTQVLPRSQAEDMENASSHLHSAAYNIQHVCESIASEVLIKEIEATLDSKPG